MGLVVMIAVDRTGKPVPCDFECSTSGPNNPAPATVSSDGKSTFPITLPPAGGLIPLMVRAKPKSSKLWSTTVHYAVDDKGVLRRLKGRPEDFSFQSGIRVGNDVVIQVVALLSPLRDVTQESFNEMLVMKDESDPLWPPASWNAPTVSPFSAVVPGILSGTDVAVTATPYTPSTMPRMLELAGPVTPKRLMVCWPNALARTATAKPTPYLVYFTHLLNQNRQAWHPLLEAYPTGWGYHRLGMYYYLNRSVDAFNTAQGGTQWRGLLQQMSAAGKTLPLVIPVGDARRSSTPEVGDCVDAALLHALLLEIDAFMFREAGLFRAPNPELGACALAAFSSGNNQVATFLNSAANRGTPFYKEVLMELYSFDNPRGNVPGYVRLAAQWLAAGSKPDAKALRLYGTHGPTYQSVHPAVFPGLAVPKAAPFVSSTATRTIAALPEPSWKAASGSDNAGHVHELIAASMLTDALRRSMTF